MNQEMCSNFLIHDSLFMIPDFSLLYPTFPSPQQYMPEMNLYEKIIVARFAGICFGFCF